MLARRQLYGHSEDQKRVFHLVGLEGERRLTDDARLERIQHKHWNLRFVRDDLLFVGRPQNAHQTVLMEVHDADQVRGNGGGITNDILDEGP